MGKCVESQGLRERVKSQGGRLGQQVWGSKASDLIFVVVYWSATWSAGDGGGLVVIWCRIDGRLDRSHEHGQTLQSAEGRNASAGGPRSGGFVYHRWINIDKRFQHESPGHERRHPIGE
ncbi:unnamed protein product [Calypogeia fissa]